MLWACFNFFLLSLDSTLLFLKREREDGEVIFRVLPGTLFPGPAVPFLNVSGHILSQQPLTECLCRIHALG